MASTSATPARVREQDESLSSDASESRDEIDGKSFLAALADLGEILAVKRYRLNLEPVRPVPLLPCLDHEALLHEGIAPHAAAYLRDHAGNLHEAVCTPRDRHIDVDIASTMDEYTPDSHVSFIAALAKRFPDWQVRATPVSWLHGDRRVAHACRAQVTLREVLTGHDLDRTQLAVDRLKIISSLMEKESRVASWGARTIMTPFLALVGLLILWSIGAQAGALWVVVTRYVVTLAWVFLMYAGLKAVHLTEMANRVWKRSAEYGLILNERQRLSR
jgi:hypothetical protein